MGTPSMLLSRVLVHIAMFKPAIKLNQKWKNKKSNFTVMITGKSNVSHKWKAVVLTDKHDFYAGSHTLSQWTLWKKFDLQ